MDNHKKNHKSNKNEFTNAFKFANGLLSVQETINLLYETGLVEHITGDVIYSKDKLEIDCGTSGTITGEKFIPVVSEEYYKDNQIIGAYSVIKLKGFNPLVECMSIKDLLNKVMKLSSAGFNRNSLWVRFYNKILHEMLRERFIEAGIEVNLRSLNLNSLI